MNQDPAQVAIINPSVMSNNKHIAVIGAGACGLCAAKYLTQSEFDVTIFEIGSQIEVILDTDQEALILCRPKSGQYRENVLEEFAQRVKRSIDRNRAT